MPHAIHEAAARKQMYYNITRPQETVPEVLPDDFRGTTNQGLPVKLIPHLQYPMVVYMWPNQAAKTVVHRNDKHEVVHEEEVPLEHLTQIIVCDAHKNGGPKDCAACNKLLGQALVDGWVTKPYVPAPPPPEDSFYGPRKKEIKK